MGEFNVNKSDGSLEQTAGMPETYPAEQVMMSDGVTSVEDRIEPCNYNTAVNIASYTSESNYYTCPTDGYVRFNAASGNIANVRLLNAARTSSATIMQTDEKYVSIYLRKDSKIFAENIQDCLFLTLS